VGTACLFVVPVWPSRPFYQTLLRLSPAVFERVGHWAAGSNLFTSPVPAHRGTGREHRGPTQWATEAWWARPEPTFNPHTHAY
jgi:hypothetical protein